MFFTLPMKLVHNITVSVFIQEPGIEKSLHQLIPANWQKLDVRRQETQTHDETPMTILSIALHRNRDMQPTVQWLLGGLSEAEKKYCLRRIDDQSCLYVRLDKLNFLAGQRNFIEGGQCVHVRIKLAAYPSNRDNAMKIFDQLLASVQPQG